MTVKSCVEQFHALANDRVTKWFGGMVSQQFSWKPRKHWLQNTLMGIFDRKLEFIINFLELRLFHKSIYYSWGEEHLQLNAKVEQDQNQWTYVWLDLDQETLCIEWICWNSSKFVFDIRMTSINFNTQTTLLHFFCHISYMYVSVWKSTDFTSNPTRGGVKMVTAAYGNTGWGVFKQGVKN